MKSLNNILEQKYLTFYSATASVIILPIYVHYLPPVMIFWGLAWFAENRFTFSGKMFIQNKAVILFILFLILYLWQISGLLLTDSLNSGFERIIKRLSFLLFPLVLFYPGERILSNIKLITRIFAIATLAYLIYCFGNALYESLSFTGGVVHFNPHPPIYEYENYFFSYRLSEPAHPSYMAMFVVLSMVIALDAVFDISLKIIKRIFWTFCVLIFVAMLYLLSSRAGFLAGSIALILFLFYELFNRLPKIVTIAIVMLLSVSMFFFARHNTRINYFLESVSGENFTEEVGKDIRYTIWESTFSVIKENMILGVGTGDASNELKKEFTARGYVEGFYDNMNAHNQFLEIFLENGIIGLMIFITLFGFMIYFSLIQRNLVSGLFILTMLIFFTFETILNRLAGITFFTLFSFLLYYYKSDNSRRAIEKDLHTAG